MPNLKELSNCWNQSCDVCYFITDGIECPFSKRGPRIRWPCLKRALAGMEAQSLVSVFPSLAAYSIPKNVGLTTVLGILFWLLIQNTKARSELLNFAETSPTRWRSDHFPRTLLERETRPHGVRRICCLQNHFWKWRNRVARLKGPYGKEKVHRMDRFYDSVRKLTFLAETLRRVSTRKGYTESDTISSLWWSH